jgi:hypothetical protein
LPKSLRTVLVTVLIAPQIKQLFSIKERRMSKQIAEALVLAVLLFVGAATICLARGGDGDTRVR